MSATNPCCKCVRWAVNVKQIEPVSASNFRRAIQSIQPEECTRVERFVYRDDQLVSLVGRLFLRQAVLRHSGARWSDIWFERSDRGKPILLRPTASPDFSFNVSHQGEYVIFGTSCSPGGIGVDVMKLDRPTRYQNADEYIDFLKKEYSATEYASMKSQRTEADKLLYFYRYWCLKESIIKATGVGIHEKLASLDFRPGSHDLNRSSVQLDTVLFDGNVPQSQWTFEESYLNDNHVAAVCRETNLPVGCRLSTDASSMIFEHVSLADLLKGAEIINQLPDDGRLAFEKFDAKKYKHF